MKTALCLLLSLLAIANACACRAACTTPTVVQVSTPALFPNGAAGATATAMLSGVAANDSLIALVFGGSGSGSSDTVTVNDGAAYTADLEQNQINGGSVYTQAAVYHRHLVSAGSYTIVATNGGGSFASYGMLVVLEVSGLANANPDVKNPNNATSGSPTVGPGSPTCAGALAIGVTAITGSPANPITLSSPSGYTNAAQQLNGTLAGQFCGSADYLIKTATSATTPTWSSSGNSDWSAVQVIFEGASAVPPAGGNMFFTTGS